MGYYRASFGGGGSGQYTQKDIDSFYIDVAGVKYYPICNNIGLFNRNTTFNSPINIGDNVASMNSICRNAFNFNSSVKIGNNVTDMGFAFQNCNIFNHSINIPDSMINAYGVFENCKNFNSHVNLGNGVVDCRNMFCNCSNFNQSITIPASVNNCGYMLCNCDLFGSDIYVKGTQWRGIYILYMLNSYTGVGYSHRKNIWFNSVLNNIFNGQSVDGNIIGYSEISWTKMTNGFYNASYNIYCYNNYPG